MKKVRNLRTRDTKISEDKEKAGPQIKPSWGSYVWRVFLDQWKGSACLSGLVHSQVRVVWQGFHHHSYIRGTCYMKVNGTNMPVALGTTLPHAMYFILVSLYDFKWF